MCVCVCAFVCLFELLGNLLLNFAIANEANLAISSKTKPRKKRKAQAKNIPNITL